MSFYAAVAFPVVLDLTQRLSKSIKEQKKKEKKEECERDTSSQAIDRERRKGAKNGN